MPKRTDIKRVLVIGSGPIVIGQAAEFDYSGTQACRALRSEGLEVVLVNSNPATIMTDPEFSDATYVEPLTPEIVEAIIAKEKPDALLPTVGGQTALNRSSAFALRDHVDEPIEEVMTVLRTGRRLGMVLHREGWLVRQAQAFVDAIEQRDMRDFGVLRQRLG